MSSKKKTQVKRSGVPPGGAVRAKPAPAAARGMAALSGRSSHDDGSLTGIPDVEYNLISVLYHALQGVESAEMYLEEAEEDGDEDLHDYLHEVSDTYRELAQRGRDLLIRKLVASERDEEE